MIFFFVTIERKRIKGQKNKKKPKTNKHTSLKIIFFLLKRSKKCSCKYYYYFFFGKTILVLTLENFLYLGEETLLLLLLSWRRCRCVGLHSFLRS